MREIWQVITSLPAPVLAEGHAWKVVVEGTARADGTWAGRLLFTNGRASRTSDQETTQPNRAALEYWAGGLETVYLEGALRRAR